MGKVYTTPSRRLPTAPGGAGRGGRLQLTPHAAGKVRKLVGKESANEALLPRFKREDARAAAPLNHALLGVLGERGAGLGRAGRGCAAAGLRGPGKTVYRGKPADVFMLHIKHGGDARFRVADPLARCPCMARRPRPAAPCVSPARPGRPRQPQPLGASLALAPHAAARGQYGGRAVTHIAGPGGVAWGSRRPKAPRPINGRHLTANQRSMTPSQCAALQERHVLRTATCIPAYLYFGTRVSKGLSMQR